ncbi:MAG: hypothetical protein PHV34_07450 [Verrucomicrobiae bacterium]|nr:hypothetical protein [Verrucomicrobiae bacterium]
MTASQPTEVKGLRRILGLACHHCPFCSYGRKHPNSLIGKLMHSSLHANHCPAWNAEKALYPETNTAADRKTTN